MNCLRAQKRLALYAGADLPGRKARRMERHLGICTKCRTELDELQDALNRIRVVASREALDWPEDEWKGLMARVRSEQPEARRRSALLPAFPQKAWAYGLASVMVLGIAALIMRSILAPPASSPLSEAIAATPAQPSRALATEKAAAAIDPQDVSFKVRREKKEPDRTVLAAKPAAEKTIQDSVSMILVSQQTGLKVHWTFNRNFEWEEKKR